ncbi:MAG: hypothetical protein EBZ40_09740 [Gammaproteobacteria bacterium]|nr:hypothetical protein [Gammaproteobacteria bacterium]
MNDAEYDAHLFAHQRAAVARMVDMETRDECVLNESESIEARVAFYTDPPGAGKTRGIIGLVLRTANEPRAPRPNIKCSYTVQNLVRVAHTGGVPSARLTRTTLIVVTASLVAQWERELARSTTIKASLVVVRRVAEATAIATHFERGRVSESVSDEREARRGSESAREGPTAREARRGRGDDEYDEYEDYEETATGLTDLTDHSTGHGTESAAEDPLVVLVCSRRYDVVAARLSSARVVMRRVVVDEARRLDVSFAATVSRDFLWLVSAATETACAAEIVSCHSRCFWSGLRNLGTQYVRAITVRSSDEELVYACNVTVRHYVCALDSRIASAVRGLVPHAVRERLDANDMQAALAHLGGGSDLMTVVRRRAELDLEQARIDIRRAEHIISAAVPEGAQRALRVAQLEAARAKEARILRDIAVAEERFRDALSSQCAICCDDMRNPVLLTCCQNLYCGACILTWIHAHGRCPTCRSNNLRVEPIDDGTRRTTAAPVRARTKIEILNEIVAAATGGVIVYSVHVDGLAAAHTALAESGVSVGFIKGMSTTRDKRISEFTQGKVKVLLLDAQVNCAGLDLLALTDVVLYHDMPADVKTQIIGRGRRINRVAPMTVHCLFENPAGGP